LLSSATAALSIDEAAEEPGTFEVFLRFITFLTLVPPTPTPLVFFGDPNASS